MLIPCLKILSLSVCGFMLVGCSTTGSLPTGSTKPSSTEYIRDNRGVTQYRIREGNVFTPNGARVARIDSNGNIYNTRGQRIGSIKK